MAPYTVAHLKLALQLQETGFEFAQGERLHVYLTNTLDQLHQKTAAMLGQWIARENEGAEKIKRDSPMVVVVGKASRPRTCWPMLTRCAINGSKTARAASWRLPTFSTTATWLLR